MSVAQERADAKRMARSDWVSLAVTLIGIFLAWVLGGAKAALLCGIIGVTILLVMIFSRRDNRREVPSQANQQAASPVITQTANPTVNINVGQQSHPQPVVSTPSPAPQSKPNIGFVGTKSVDAHQGLTDSLIYESPQQGLGDFQICVVCFRNESIVGQRIQEPNVEAHIIYKNKEGDEITDAPRGVWVGHHGEAIQFESGKKRCLVVFLLSSQGTLKKLWTETYTTGTSWMAGGSQYRIRDSGIAGEVKSVEISLLTRDTCLLRATFDVMPREADKLPKLVLSSVSAG